MNIKLTEAQARDIALRWIEGQQGTHDGYKIVLKTLLSRAHFASWSWFDALGFAVNLCAKEYYVPVRDVLKDLLKAVELPRRKT